MTPGMVKHRPRQSDCAVMRIEAAGPLEQDAVRAALGELDVDTLPPIFPIPAKTPQIAPESIFVGDPTQRDTHSGDKASVGFLGAQKGHEQGSH